MQYEAGKEVTFVSCRLCPGHKLIGVCMPLYVLPWNGYFSQCMHKSTVHFASIYWNTFVPNIYFIFLSIGNTFCLNAFPIFRSDLLGISFVTIYSQYFGRFYWKYSLSGAYYTTGMRFYFPFYREYVLWAVYYSRQTGKTTAFKL